MTVQLTLIAMAIGAWASGWSLVAMCLMGVMVFWGLIDD